MMVVCDEILIYPFVLSNMVMRRRAVSALKGDHYHVYRLCRTSQMIENNIMNNIRRESRILKPYYRQNDESIVLHNVYKTFYFYTTVC